MNWEGHLVDSVTSLHKWRVTRALHFHDPEGGMDCSAFLSSERRKYQYHGFHQDKLYPDEAKLKRKRVESS